MDRRGETTRREKQKKKLVIRGILREGLEWLEREDWDSD